MPRQKCLIATCPDLNYGHGWCRKHWRRWKIYGDPLHVVAAYGDDREPGDGTRWCSHCREFRPLTQFHGNKSWCGPCRIASRYRLSRTEYEALLVGLCPLCMTRSKEVVDHDHRCCPPPTRMTCGNCTRGGLCRQCNAALGILTEAGVLRAKVWIARRIGNKHA